MRTKRTLLVEGIKDKQIIERLLIETKGDDPNDCDLVIDTAEQFRDCPGIMSNREKVEYIHGIVSNHSKLGGWVDREFRLFAVEQTVKDQLSDHNVVHASLFWTRGHSIENYFFDIRIVLRYIEQFFPEHLPANYRESTIAVMEPITRIAAAVTLAAKDSNLLSRMTRLFSTKLWSVGAGLLVSLKIDAIRVALRVCPIR
jgi:hypothetical protein